jgi:sec-independent protein translocase protein TatA
VSLPGGWELVLVVLVIMVLFGAKRLPEASRSLGRSLRIFKAETKGLRDDTDTTLDGTPIGHTRTTAEQAGPQQEPHGPSDPSQPRQP